MPRTDHYPPDIMDKAQAFTDALNAYLALTETWELRYSPNQLRLPAGQPGGGQWTDGGSGGATPAVYRPGDKPPSASLLTDVARRTTPLPEAEDTRRALAKPPGEFHESLADPQPTKIGPPSEMRPDVPKIRADSFDQFKNIVGPAEKDHAYHHIIEQGQLDDIPGIDNSDKGILNNSDNIIEIPTDVHICINKKTQTKDEETRKSPREENRGKPLKEQYDRGMEILKGCMDEHEKSRASENNDQPSKEPQSERVQTLDPTPVPRLPTPIRPGGGRTSGSGPFPGFKPGFGSPRFGPLYPLPLM